MYFVSSNWNMLWFPQISSSHHQLCNFHFCAFGNNMFLFVAIKAFIFFLILAANNCCQYFEQFTQHTAEAIEFIHNSKSLKRVLNFCLFTITWPHWIFKLFSSLFTAEKLKKDFVCSWMLLNSWWLPTNCQSQVVQIAFSDKRKYIYFIKQSLNDIFWSFKSHF